MLSPGSKLQVPVITGIIQTLSPTLQNPEWISQVLGGMNTEKGQAVPHLPDSHPGDMTLSKGKATLGVGEIELSFNMSLRGGLVSTNALNFYSGWGGS